MRAQFEDVHWTGHESFLVRTFDLPPFTVPWHFHPEPELTLILEGGGDRCVGDHLESFRAGDLVLLGGNLPHYWHSHAPANAGKGRQERARAVVVHLREEYFGGSLLSLPEAASWKKLLDHARRGLAFEGRTASHASRDLERLPGMEGSHQLLTLLGILQTLSDGAADTRPLAGEHYLPACDDHAADRVRRVYQFIYAHLAEPIGLDDLARAAGMSSAAFCRYCKRVTGRTPTRLLSELRITQACKLLTDTAQSVSEVAFASGFQSISNFNRVFQQIKATSPQSFRRHHARKR
jgi:AraC-like DNA-binding protein